MTQLASVPFKKKLYTSLSTEVEQSVEKKNPDFAVSGKVTKQVEKKNAWIKMTTITRAGTKGYNNVGLQSKI